MIEIVFKKPDVRLLLKVLHGPSTTDPRVADIYNNLQRLLDEDAPKFPWRKVTQATGGSAYRGDSAAVILHLECGHRVREVGPSDYELKRRLERGEIIKRRCHECAGMASRNAKP